MLREGETAGMFPPSGTMRHDFAVTPTLSRATWKWMVSRLGADAKISHEFSLRARCHELARIFLLPFVKIRVIRGRKLRSALERETTWKCDGQKCGACGQPFAPYPIRPLGRTVGEKEHGDRDGKAGFT